MAGTSAPIERPTASDGAMSLLSKAVLAGSFTFLLGLSAQFKIPMPPDGVPQTLQTLVVAIAAMGLGGRWGTISILLYLIIGALGAGVFSEGQAGVGVLMGQTGGFLFGFLLAQPVIASIIRRRDGTVRGWGAIVSAMLAGHAVIFLIGVPWFAVVRDFTLVRAFQGACFPFLPGMLIKTIAAVFIGLACWPNSARRFW